MKFFVALTAQCVEFFLFQSKKHMIFFLLVQNKLYLFNIFKANFIKGFFFFAFNSQSRFENKSDWKCGKINNKRYIGKKCSISDFNCVKQHRTEFLSNKIQTGHLMKKYQQKKKFSIDIPLRCDISWEHLQFNINTCYPTTLMLYIECTRIWKRNVIFHQNERFFFPFVSQISDWLYWFSSNACLWKISSFF